MFKNLWQNDQKEINFKGCVYPITFKLNHMARAVLTPALHAFLQQLGYSHLLSQGVLPPRTERSLEETQHDEEEGDFMLIPLRPGDLRISNPEADQAVDALDSEAVQDMLQGDVFLQFLVELPDEEYARIA
jgi:hypothetical protein